MSAYPREARYLIDWSGQSRVSYHDFLQAKQFEGSVRYAIDNQTKGLVATNQQLHERGIEVLQESLDENFSLLSQGLGDISEGIEGVSNQITELSRGVAGVREAIEDGTKEVTATLHWGFSALRLSVGGLQDSLNELIAIARTPSQTWAYEQFEIARDEFERQLYSEALDSLNRAIDGYGSNAGYKTEFRFHFLLGTIRLGSYQNSDLAIVHPGEAELAFVNAARYAEHNHPLEAAHALTSAGRSAFVQGQLDRAFQYTNRALSLNPRLAPALYQMARIYWVRDDLNSGAKALYNSIIIDPDLSICASGETDFLSNHIMLNKVIDAAKNHFAQIATMNIQKFEVAIKKFSGFAYYNISTKQLLDNEVLSLQQTLSRATQSLKTGTLLGGVKAIETLKPSEIVFSDLFEEYKRRFVAFVRANREGVFEQGNPSRDNAPRQNHSGFQSILQAAGVVVLVAFLFVLLCLWVNTLPDSLQSGIKSFLVVFVIIPSPIWAGILFARARQHFRDSNDREFRRLLDHDAALERQRLDANATRRRNKLAEIEATITRLSEMPRPEFWPAEANRR